MGGSKAWRTPNRVVDKTSGIGKTTTKPMHAHAETTNYLLPMQCRLHDSYSDLYLEE